MDNPQQRRGESGPFNTEGGASADFEPFDNEIYFDPNYAGSLENGAINNPWLSWTGWTSAIGSDSWKVFFPGVEVSEVGATITLTEGNNLVLQGVKASHAGSYLSETIEIDELDPAEGASLEIRFIDIVALRTNGGDYDLLFRDSIIEELTEASNAYNGTVTSYNTSFQTGGLSLPTATVRLNGGNVEVLEASTIYLNELIVGTADEGGAGQIECGGSLIKCKEVTFVTGTTIEFTGEDPGELWLDGPSYKSFLDNDIVLTNGHVTRDDGSWPVDAIVYAPNDLPINFAKNPRAILELDDDVNLTVIPPLTREVQLLVIQDEAGGHEIDFSTCVPEIRWTDGVPPEQDTTSGSISLYRFDYEESLDYFIGWAVAMNALPE